MKNILALIQQYPLITAALVLLALVVVAVLVVVAREVFWARSKVCPRRPEETDSEWLDRQW